MFQMKCFKNSNIANIKDFIHVNSSDPPLQSLCSIRNGGSLKISPLVPLQIYFDPSSLSQSTVFIC